MKLYYYRETDSLYIVLAERDAADSGEAEPRVVLDSGAAEHRVGIDCASEILNPGRGELKESSVPKHR